MPSFVRGWARHAAAWSFGFVLAGALYLLLIDITDLPELIVGAVVAAIAATGFGLAREQYLAVETFRVEDLRFIYRPLLQVPSDVVSLARLAIAQALHPQAERGRFRAVPFRCTDDEAREIGRRALSESLGSFAPNTIIVGVDPERQLLLGHQLQRRGGDEAIDVLRLG
jgi:hypothetical protein